MNLQDYFATGVESQSDLARKLKITPVLIHQWKTGARQVPANRCPDIERETNGVVRCEDLRPGVDWAILRGITCTPLPSDCNQPAPA
jgi:DNA-binding transcriptional regulator YdaS (Cro superfamily)